MNPDSAEAYELLGDVMLASTNHSEAVNAWLKGATLSGDQEMAQ